MSIGQDAVMLCDRNGLKTGMVILFEDKRVDGRLKCVITR